MTPDLPRLGALHRRAFDVYHSIQALAPDDAQSQRLSRHARLVAWRLARMLDGQLLAHLPRRRGPGFGFAVRRHGAPSRTRPSFGARAMALRVRLRLASSPRRDASFVDWLTRRIDSLQLALVEQIAVTRDSRLEHMLRLRERELRMVLDELRAWEPEPHGMIVERGAFALR